MDVPPSKHMIYNLSFGWHTLYCTTIELKFPMDAPFVVKANYYSPFLAPLALLVAPLLVLYLPGYVTREILKSTRTVPLFWDPPFPVPDFPLVPFVPILVILLGKPGPLPSSSRNLIHQILRILPSAGPE
jgi:hypothetical protein